MFQDYTKKTQQLEVRQKNLVKTHRERIRKELSSIIDYTFKRVNK